MENLASKWKTVWITGASSGIGKELTQRFAQSGVKVAASARSEQKLAQLAADNPNVHPYPLDVTDNEAVLAATQKIVEDLGPIDLAILNAGTYLRQRADIAFSAKLCRDTMDVNFGGVANCVEGLLPNMLARDAGHVSIVASVAGLRGLPNASAYSPTKAACISLCESLSLDLQETNLKVSVINPGFVETPLIEGNDFWMPFLITPNVAANSIIDGLKKGKYDITFPWPMRLTMKSLKSMPNKLYFLIMRPVARARAAAAREDTEIPTKT